MKKIVYLLLAINTGLFAQVPIPKSTTTFSNISATGNVTAQSLSSNGTFNYNRNYLKDWDAQIAKIQQATASSTASIVWIGDSWTMNGTITQPISNYLRNKWGDAGCGYYGAATINTGSSYGSNGQQVTITRVGSWADVKRNTYVNSVSLAADSSNVLGDSVYYVGNMTNAVIHYMKKASGGSFVYRVDGTSPATVSTSGTKSLNFTSITGLTDGTHTLSIKVSTAGQGVLISGVEINRNTNGVRVHNLGASGSTAQEWIYQDSTNFASGLQQLSPNMAVICLGVNDAIGGVTTTSYVGYITRIVNRVKTAMPNCGIVLFTPSDIGAATTYSMSQYVSALKTYALANNYGFIDNYSLIGDYTTANTRGLYTNTTHVNNTGGNVMSQNFQNYLMNGMSMYYSNGLNTSYGENSLLSAVASGTANVGIGFSALKNNKSGNYNTASGYNALSANTTGPENTATGYNSLLSNVSGQRNSAYGALSLRLNTGNFNSAFGYSTLNNNTSGTNNSAFGYLALTTNTGSSNSAFGAQALQSVTGGTYNCGFGTNTAQNTTGDYNSAFGASALFTNSSGNRNTAIGYSSLYSNTGSNNTGIGMFSLYNTTGGSNTGIGYSVMQTNTTGSLNVAIGDNAGFSNSTGSSNVFIGHNAGYYETGSNALYIDNQSRTDLSTQKLKSLIYGTFGTTPATQTLVVNAHLTALHVVCNATAAPTATVGSGAGTGATYTLSTNSTDLSGLISITTGTASMGAGATLITLTFNSAYSVAPNIVLTPANSAAAVLTGNSQVYVDGASTGTTTFLLKTGSSVLTTSTVFKWYYTVFQ